LLGAMPYGLWQLAHGLPQAQLEQSIAHSGSEGGRLGFVPFQLALIGPLLAPIWIAGVVGLLRDKAFRCFAAAYLVLIPVLLATGGKAYYMAGLYPVLLAAGGVAAERWLNHGRARTVLLVGPVALTAAASAVIGLCVLPVRDLQGSVVIAKSRRWRDRRVASVHADRRGRLPLAPQRPAPSAQRARVAIFTSNYGEAGAIAHFGPTLGLPYPYSGHNGWALWGPPPDSDTTALLVGVGQQQATHDFTGCQLRARIDNREGLDNQEQGAPLRVCTGERLPWSRLWRTLRHYD
jgi:hypothetical protein